MFIQAAFIIIFCTITVSSSQLNVQYTEEDFKVIRAFTKSLRINNLAFVTDDKNSGLINYLKHDLYSTVLSSGQLGEILNADNVKVFFATPTVIVSKENLNQTIKFQRLSDRSLVWVAFISSLTALPHFYIPINTDFYTVRYTPRAIVINKAYHIRPDLNITLKSIGVWRRESVDSITINKNRTFDYEGTALGMLHFLDDDDCKNFKELDFLNRIECFHQEILRILSDVLNYKIRKVYCEERVYPYNFPNGSLAHLFSMLERTEVDFSSGSYIITKERLVKYDFVWPVFTSRSMMYIKERKQNHWRAYLRPIDKYLWQAICIWILTVGLLFQFFEDCLENRFQLRLSLLSDIIKALFLSLQVFCSQGISEMSKWSSIRILFIMSFFLFLILYEIYSGFLISFLMTDVPYIPFTDINGFFQDGRFKLFSLNRGFHNYFTNKILNDYKQDPTHFKLPDEQLPEKIEEGIRILCTGQRFAYVEFRENIAMHEIPCSVTELSRSLLHQSIGVGLPKNSPFREPCQKGIVSINSAGIVQRMRKQLFSLANLKEKEISNDEYVKVSLNHVISIFFVLGMGMTLALALFVLELVFILSKKLKNGFTSGRPHLKILHFRAGRNLFACIFLRWPKYIFRKK